MDARVLGRTPPLIGYAVDILYPNVRGLRKMIMTFEECSREFIMVYNPYTSVHILLTY